MILVVCLAAASVLFIGLVLFVFDFVTTRRTGLWAAGDVFVLVLAIWLAATLLI